MTNSKDSAIVIKSGCVLLLVPHAESQPRSSWIGDENARPLHPRGLEQAERLAQTIGRVNAVYSSPSRRCIQTVEPLATASAVPIIMLEDLREAFLDRDRDEWDWWLDETMRVATRGASVAGRAVQALQRIDADHDCGRIIVCSHGDTIPIIISFLAATYGVSLPEPIDRGGWYEVTNAKIEPRGRLLRAEE